jgi:hypothetical protein
VKLTTLFLLFTATTFGATDAPPIDPGGDFSPMLAAFALVALIIVLILVGIGIVLAAIVAASMAILAGLGIISSAALIGIVHRRISSGLRAFHYQLLTLLAMPAGIGALWGWARFFDRNLTDRELLVMGSISGISAGLLLAFFLDRLACIAYRRLLPQELVSNSRSC